MLKVSDIMTKDVVTASASTTVRELAEIFDQKHFGTIPLVDTEGNLQGIVTASDLLEQGKNLHIPTVISIFDWVIPIESTKSLERDLHKMTAQTAGELASQDVVTVSPDAAVSDAADLMSNRKLHALPVVDAGKVVGMVARIDIIRSMIK